MNNFTFYSPTYFVFGKDEENNAGKYVKRFGGTKVLIHYGGGSVVRSGLLDRIKKSLKSSEIDFVELGAPLADSAYIKGENDVVTGFAGKVYALTGDNSIKEAAPLTTTYVAKTTGVEEGITVTGIEENGKVLVVYDASVAGDKVTAIADASNELLNVTAEVLLKELCNEKKKKI